ncbi:hypothetical protein CEXT_758581 [Caerostris extrusa]|uniref:Uncharacterized protein n=1 Tax=Caerostris extrusa TaxID=172846 RepID=A0AAV4Q0D3_CAEEX|nr:hypothetical protein CEXT_758581 [Caerostris extrusa]
MGTSKRSKDVKQRIETKNRLECSSDNYEQIPEFSTKDSQVLPETILVNEKIKFITNHVQQNNIDGNEDETKIDETSPKGSHKKYVSSIHLRYY